MTSELKTLENSIVLDRPKATRAYLNVNNLNRFKMKWNYGGKFAEILKERKSKTEEPFYFSPISRPASRLLKVVD